jgi:hypothetical protein
LHVRSEVCILPSLSLHLRVTAQRLSVRCTAMRRLSEGRMRHVIQYSPLRYQANRKCWGGLSCELACHLLECHDPLPPISTMPHQATLCTPPGREKETASRQTTSTSAQRALTVRYRFSKITRKSGFTKSDFLFTIFGFHTEK